MTSSTHTHTHTHTHTRTMEHLVGQATLQPFVHATLCFILSTRRLKPIMLQPWQLWPRRKNQATAGISYVTHLGSFDQGITIIQLRNITLLSTVALSHYDGVPKLLRSDVSYASVFFFFVRYHSAITMVLVIYDYGSAGVLLGHC